MANYQAIAATSNAVRPMFYNAALDSERSDANVVFATRLGME